MKYKTPYLVILLSIFSFLSNAKYVKIGDEYTKIPYKKAYANSNNSNVSRLIENTVLINSATSRGTSRGTGFYIGMHNGHHLFLTNAHVLSSDDCRNGAVISFLDNGMKIKKAVCEKVHTFLYKKDKSDITLFSMSSESIKDMIGEGLEIDMDFSPRAGQLLASHGFGLKKSSNAKLTKFNPNTTYDNDCAVSSADHKLVYISNFKANYVFATGCDMAEGDSGSAIIDRDSGKVVGIFFLIGENAKRRNRITSESFWNDIVGTNDKKIWQNMSYAISLKSVGEKLFKFLDFN